MGGLPTSKEGLQALGWIFDNESHCRGCGAPIEWWCGPPTKRSPKGAKMPMDVVPVKETDNFFAPVREFKRIPHWASCENAKDFRRKQT